MNQRELKMVQNRLIAWEYELKTNKHGFQHCAKNHVNYLREMLKSANHQSGPGITRRPGSSSKNG
jgi:hypothetical protein